MRPTVKSLLDPVKPKSDSGLFDRMTTERKAWDAMPCSSSTPGEIIDFPNPDYVALARACGAVGFRAEKPSELHDAIDKALKARGRLLSTAWSRPASCRMSRTLI